MSIVDGVVLIDNFVETEPKVVEALLGADDVEGATHSLLRVGAEAVRVASVDLSAEVVERRFQVMTSSFDSTVTAAVAAIEANAASLLDPETGTLPSVLSSLHGELESLLGDTFDPDSKSGAIAKIEEAVEGISVGLLRQVQAAFSLDIPDSPLARTKRDMVEVVRDEIKGVLSELQSVNVALATSGAIKGAEERANDAKDKLTAKGLKYEELIRLGLSSIAEARGDVVEHVGTAFGARGTKKGDLTVTVNAEDAGGASVRFVVEAKDQRRTMRQALDELEAAAANRDASAAIAVFAVSEFAPTAGPLWYSGNRAILVYDKAEPDAGALRLAYEWARWVCRRGDDDALDANGVREAIDRARQALKHHQAVKACHGAIRRQAELAASHVADLVADVNVAIDALVAAIGSPEPDPGFANGEV